MIGPTGAVRVMVATKPVDFRKGAEGLAALVRESMGADPFSGTVYVFRAQRADRIKLVYFDGTGVCLFSKRLEDSDGRQTDQTRLARSRLRPDASLGSILDRGAVGSGRSITDAAPLAAEA